MLRENTQGPTRHAQMLHTGAAEHRSGAVPASASHGKTRETTGGDTTCAAFSGAGSSIDDDSASCGANSSGRLNHVSAHLGAHQIPKRNSRGGATNEAPAASTEFQERPNGYGTETQVHDLLITNGRVIDPANGIDAVLDVAVRWGKVVAVGENLDPNKAASVFDASGLIVTPGLIDAHVHCFTSCTTLGIPADEYCLGRGCTTVVDAGSAGPATLPAFHDFIVKQQRTRVLAMCHVASAGLANGVFVEPQER